MNMLVSHNIKKVSVAPPPDYYDDDDYLDEATGFSSEDDFDDCPGPPPPSSIVPSRKFDICKYLGHSESVNKGFYFRFRWKCGCGALFNEEWRQNSGRRST